MQRLRTQHWTIKALVALLLCGLFVQAQIVYSCQMMDIQQDMSHQGIHLQDMHDGHDMPEKHAHPAMDTSKPMQSETMTQCCCADSASDSMLLSHQDTASSSCCDIDATWSMKTADAFNNVPTLLKSHHTLDPPLPLLALVATLLWSEPTTTLANQFTWDFHHEPANPGTRTYLSTLRLRI